MAFMSLLTFYLNITSPYGLSPCASAGDTRDTGPIPESGKSLEEEMATHSSILDFEIPWTEEPGDLQSVELQRVKQD